MKRKIELCGIYNIKNNLCTEDCKFCAQGILAKNRGSAKKITFDAKAIDAAMRAAENDLTRFGLVASSRGPSRGSRNSGANLQRNKKTCEYTPVRFARNCIL